MIVVVLAGVAVVVLLVAVCGLGGWRMRRRGRSLRRVVFRRVSGALAGTPAVGRVSGRAGRGVEARLVSRLLAGELSAVEYREAMAGLAADDAVRHPVVVPDR
jgi:hypothetical protein